MKTINQLHKDCQELFDDLCTRLAEAMNTNVEERLFDTLPYLASHGSFRVAPDVLELGRATNEVGKAMGHLVSLKETCHDKS